MIFLLNGLVGREVDMESLSCFGDWKDVFEYILRSWSWVSMAPPLTIVMILVKLSWGWADPKLEAYQKQTTSHKHHSYY